MTEDLQQLTGPTHGPANGGKPDRLVVLLHGLGADGNDLIGLAPHWQQLLPSTLFVSPHAHQPCDMAPAGEAAGRQWFSLADRTPSAMRAGADAALPVLNNFLDACLVAHGLTDDAMALVGFSQGGMMALQAGLRRPHTCAGVACFSGVLIGANDLADQITARPPILLVHGEVDELIPATSLDVSKSALSGFGIEAETHLLPGLGHGIDERGLATGGEFLARTLGSAHDAPA